MTYLGRMNQFLAAERESVMTIMQLTFGFDGNELGVGRQEQ